MSAACNLFTESISNYQKRLRIPPARWALPCLSMATTPPVSTKSSRSMARRAIWYGKTKSMCLGGPDTFKVWAAHRDRMDALHARPWSLLVQLHKIVSSSNRKAWLYGRSWFAWHNNLGVHVTTIYQSGSTVSFGTSELALIYKYNRTYKIRCDLSTHKTLGDQSLA